MFRSTRRLLPAMLCALLSPLCALAQRPYDIILDTQAKVDAYDPADLLGRDVFIDGDDITNLDHLAIVTHFESLFIRNNPNLTSISGLANLSSVYSLMVLNNDKLSSIDVLGGVAISNEVWIEHNALLTHLPPFSNTSHLGNLRIVGNPELISAEMGSIENIDRILTISDNAKLIDLSGFNSLKSIGQLDLDNLPNTTIDGFLSLTTLNYINITNNANLVDITGFPAVQRISEFIVNNNTSLERIDGFISWNEMFTLPLTGSARRIMIFDNPKLTGLEGFARIQTLDDLRIYDNAGLKNVDGFRGLQRVPSVYFLQIVGNPSLENLDGLSNLDEIDESGVYSKIWIYNNPALTHPCGIFPYLTAFNATYPAIHVFDNLNQPDNYLEFYGNGFTLDDLMICGSVQAPFEDALIQLGFDEADGIAPTNTGSASATFVRSDVWPASIANGPSQEPTAKSFDFGTEPGNYFVESTAPVAALASLTDFTITGWVNAKSASIGQGGNRIVSWMKNCPVCGPRGVDLVVDEKGRLKLGVNSWTDDTPAFSYDGVITVDPTGASTNWVFFAVTYKASSGNVQFYYGSNATFLWPDRKSTIPAGNPSDKIGNLAIGAFNDDIRNPETYDRMFRGAIDDIRIYGTALTYNNIWAVLFQNRDLIAPPKPVLRVVATTTTSVTLKWETPVDNAGGSISYDYRAVDMADSATTTASGSLGGSVNTLTLSDLRAGSTQRIYLMVLDQSFNTSRDSIDVVLEKMPATDGSIVHLDFNENGFIFQNLGSADATFTRSATTPLLTNNTPSQTGGANAIDYGVVSANYYLTSSTPIDALKNLDAFSITGWVNARSNVTGSGDSEIVSWINNGGDGVDLVLGDDGSLRLGINEWPDHSPAISSENKVQANNLVPASNWVFFAVTYQSDGQVKFYFGSNADDAMVDVARTYPGRGAVASDIADLAFGSANNASRYSWNYGRMFKGIIDDIRIYGQVLSPLEIVSVQRGTISGDDLIPPSAPLSVYNTSKSETTAAISWTAPPDNATITGYQIFKGTELIAETGIVTSYTVTDLMPSTTYQFSVKSIDAHGNVSAVSNRIDVTTDNPAGREGEVTAIENETDEALHLSQNFPNPFNTETTIELFVPQRVKAARVSVLDVNGSVLQDVEITERGNTRVQIRSENLKSGLYFYSLTIDGNRKETKRMALTQ